MQRSHLDYDRKGGMIGVNLDGLASSFTWEYDETSGFLNRLTYPNGMVRRNIYYPTPTLVASIGSEKQATGGMPACHEYHYHSLLGADQCLEY